MTEQLRVSDPAPDFVLRETFASNVRLTDLTRTGPAVLAFYVFDFGSVRTQELSQLGQIEPTLRSWGASVAAIAVTATFSQMAFKEHLGVPYVLLSDWEREVCDAYGVRYERWKGHTGLAKRALFLVSSAAVVRYVWSTNDALELPPMDELVEAVRSETPLTLPP